MDDNNNILLQLLAGQDQIRAAKEAYRQQNQHLSGDQLELAWLQLCGLLGAVGNAPEKPRTLSRNSQVTSPDDIPAMKLTRSEGPSIHPSRAPPLPRSPSDGPYPTLSSHDRRNPSVSAWQNDAHGNYTSSPASKAGCKRRREPLPTPMPTPRLVEAKTYDLEEFLSTLPDPAPPPSLHHQVLANDTPANYYHDQTHLSINTDPTFGWSFSSDGASTPSTPATALTETSTHSSQMMSRNGSIASYHNVNNSLTQDFNMLRVKSHNSFIEEDSNTALDLSLDPSTEFNQEEFIPESTVCCQSDPQYFVAHDQDASATSSLNFSSASSNEFSSHLPTSSHNTLVMKRSSSTQSSMSDSSTSQSRSSRRHQEQIVQANNCFIAPKVNESEKLSPVTKMVRVRSEDGSVQVKAAIARKEPYQRPQHPKLFCKVCNDQPDGFRGDHELQRHTKRAHPSGTRKVWVCVDVFGDGTFLGNCKACRIGKRYGAYYNAAAHLRRTHFNPRKRGRKAKTEAEKRGGKGGGNHPAMDFLKEHWMREIEEAVDETSPPVDSDSNAAAVDAEDEQQCEQEPLVSNAEQPRPSPVSLSPDAHCNNNTWHEMPFPFTTDCLTNAAYDMVALTSPASCYSFESQALTSPEMEHFFKLEDLQTQQATVYTDHSFSGAWSS